MGRRAPFAGGAVGVESDSGQRPRRDEVGARLAQRRVARELEARVERRTGRCAPSVALPVSVPASVTSETGRSDATSRSPV